jgi:DNA-directed RNA polymerase I, II, and III subunit RPABC4
MEDEKSYSIRVINEYDGSKVYTIEKKCLSFGAVMKELEAEGVKTNEIQLCNAKKEDPNFTRHEYSDPIDWEDRDSFEFYAYEKVYAVRVVTYTWNGITSVERTETFRYVKGTRIGEIRNRVEALFGTVNQELNYDGRKLENDETLESVDDMRPGFLDNPVLIGHISANVADEKCGQMRYLAISMHASAGELWKKFMKLSAPERVLHMKEGAKGKYAHLCRVDGCDGPHCSHTWLCHGGKFLLADDSLYDALALTPEDSSKIVYYVPPPFIITVKEKNEKNETTETKIEIEDHNTIAEVRNKYSRNAEEGLVEGDLLLLDEQDLKDERMVYSYGLRGTHDLWVQKRSSNQPMFTYICADCGNDLRLRKDEKIRCRECGHRVVYKPRLNKPLQHFAR